MFKALRKKKSPRQLARERLHATLGADRMLVSPGRLEQIKAEMRASLSRQLNVSEECIDIHTDPMRGHLRLQADVAMIRKR